MKKILVISSMIFIISSLIIACFSPWKGNEGTFSISIGSAAGNSREAGILPWYDNISSEILAHEITLSGFGNEITRNIPPGAYSAAFSVAPGKWDILVEAFTDYEKEPKKKVAVGSIKNLSIKPGPNGSIPIAMGPPEKQDLPWVYITEQEICIARSETYILEVEMRPENAVLIWSSSNENIAKVNEGRVTGVSLGTALIEVSIEGGSRSSSCKVTVAEKAGDWKALKDAVNNNSWDENGEKTILLSGSDWIADESIVINRSITLASKEAVKIARDTGFYDSFFEIAAGGNLAIEGSIKSAITLDGSKDSFSIIDGVSPLIILREGGLQISDGVFIQNNRGENGSGVGIEGGNFYMYGGTIQGNESCTGGGVNMRDGYFIMTGNALITGNKAYFDNGASSPDNREGGGVYVGSGTFIMDGGRINNNSAGYGGGVYVDTGLFTMNDGEISGNEAAGNNASDPGYGGGVFVGAVAGSADYGNFTKSNGVIYGIDSDTSLRNKASSGAGYAVYVKGTGSSPADRPTRYQNITAGPEISLDSSSPINWE
ncbi:MAG: Ig-like domain-containing protein [Treponema sp.]|jgi:hypothetical protein|nr:Ig-like domain-containing protein [Treponema sp.]